MSSSFNFMPKEKVIVNLETQNDCKLLKILSNWRLPEINIFEIYNVPDNEVNDVVNLLNISIPKEINTFCFNSLGNHINYRNYAEGIGRFAGFVKEKLWLFNFKLDSVSLNHILMKSNHVNGFLLDSGLLDTSNLDFASSGYYKIKVIGLINVTWTNNHQDWNAKQHFDRLIESFVMVGMHNNLEWLLVKECGLTQKDIESVLHNRGLHNIHLEL